MTLEPRAIWDRYERNIDRVRANLPTYDADDYCRHIRWLFRNPITEDSTTEQHQDALAAFQQVRIIEQAAIDAEQAKPKVIVGNCINWGNDTGGEG